MFNTSILNLRCDNSREYVNNDFQQFCSDKGIKLQYTVPYNPELNGVAERMNRTLVEKARTLILESKFDKEMWGEALYTAAYVTNRSPTTALTSKTPLEVWEGKVPNIVNLRVFGSAAYAHIPKILRKKLDATASKLFMVGYAVNGYRLWDAEKRKIVIARNVVFNENEKFIGKQNGNKYETEVRLEIEDHEQTLEESDSQREKRKVQRPKRFDDYILDSIESDESLFALFTNFSDEDLPKTYEEIKKRPDCEQWEEAIENELEGLNENNTWVEIDNQEKLKPLDCKWVFVKKKGEDGNEIFKARLVVKGFQQKEQFDLSEVYAPVARLQTMRILLAVSSKLNYTIRQMDVKSAFLNGEIQEEVFLKPVPPMNTAKNKVLKLQKALYGLKKSPKYWYEKLFFTLNQYGFKRSLNDFCLYVKDKLYILVYVDDLLLLGEDRNEILKIEEYLKKQFKMKHMGENELNYLGIQIKKKENGNIVLNQIKYLKDVLKKFGMDHSNPVGTPMEVGFNYNSNEIEIDESIEQVCRSSIGSLMYASVATRPDIAAAVNYLSRFQSSPSQKLWVAIKRIFRYIRGTLNLVLEYKGHDDAEVLSGWVDADWAGSDDRKSTSGYIIKVYGNTVIWNSRKQSVVALSSTEAEYIALSQGACDALWVKKILIELQVQVNKILICEDNQSAIRTAENCDQKRLRHIDIKYHFIKELVEKNMVNIKYVPSQDQVADILTKPLPKVQFNYLIESLDLRCIPDLFH